MKYDDYPTTEQCRKMEYDDYPTAHKTSNKNTKIHKPSNTILEENTTNKEGDEEEEEIFKPSTKKATSTNNLSMRWSKKQPTKSELVESFIDLKGSMSIMSNNVMAMDKRIQTLETNLSELISYINEKI